MHPWALTVKKGGVSESGVRCKAESIADPVSWLKQGAGMAAVQRWRGYGGQLMAAQLATADRTLDSARSRRPESLTGRGYGAGRRLIRSSH